MYRRVSCLLQLWLVGVAVVVVVVAVVAVVAVAAIVVAVVVVIAVMAVLNCGNLFWTFEMKTIGAHGSH